MSTGYRDLTPFYDALFPVSPAAQAFYAPLVARCRQTGGLWLDVGVGTGPLVTWLNAQDVEVRGVEPDADFARAARHKLADGPGRVLVGGAGDVERLFPNERFQVISCVGNVLAHLDGTDAVEAFFRMCATWLVASGTLVVQVVNFDRYRRQGHMDFPVLERTTADGTPFVFRRRYAPLAEDAEAVLFETELEWSDGRIRNAVRLQTLEKARLEALARRYFSTVDVMGDFSGKPWTESSPGTILASQLTEDVSFADTGAN